MVCLDELSLENNVISETILGYIYEAYIIKSNNELIEEIKKENKVDNLLFYGTYIPDAQGRNFGFFVDVTHESGKSLYYPELKKRIDRIIFFDSGLEKNKKYKFSVKISSKKEREKQKNPFLLQSKHKDFEQIIELSELEDDIKNKKDEILDLEKELQTFRDKKNKEEEKIKIEFSKLRQRTNIEINNLQDECKNRKNELENITLKRDKMESTVKFLQSKIETCKNLEFLSKEEAENYLLHLRSKKPELDGDFLDFQEDLDGDFFNLSEHILHYLYHEKKLIYTRFQIQNFITLLLTNDTIVLSGLSGSGKTQIIKAVAEAIGGEAKIIPVKPNWTSSDDLLGYYNPIQSSFLPTPFTEAIAEAIQNPHKMYLICLDEMNLARVEYYFADFLSKLEERNKQPEIELYAQHEEELFISEFRILLTLLESSIDEKDIASWKDFLENDKVRSRFFDLIGNKEDDTMLQIHSKMKRRLIDILKFPSTITIPNNVRFIGAINIDETTHYFSPKILDRVHIVRFENPLLFSDMVDDTMEHSQYNKELKPVHVHPSSFMEREELPSIKDVNHSWLSDSLKYINKNFLLPLSIDFGVRSIRQSINYAKLFNLVNTNENSEFYPKGDIVLNAIVMQKILPRFLFEDADLNSGKSKKEVLEEFEKYITDSIFDIQKAGLDGFNAGVLSDTYLRKMINTGEQINFWSISSDFISNG